MPHLETIITEKYRRLMENFSCGAIHLNLSYSKTNELMVDYNTSNMDVLVKKLQILNMHASHTFATQWNRKLYHNSFKVATQG